MYIYICIYLYIYSYIYIYIHRDIYSEEERNLVPGAEHCLCEAEREAELKLGHHFVEWDQIVVFNCLSL